MEVMENNNIQQSQEIDIGELEKRFATFMIHTYQFIVPYYAELKGKTQSVELRQEFGYLSNIYRYALDGISKGIRSAEKLHDEILKHVETLAKKNCVKNFLEFTQHLQEYKSLADRIFINSLANFSHEEISVMPLIKHSATSQLANFYDMRKKLLDELFEILKEMQSDTYSKFNFCHELKTKVFDAQEEIKKICDPKNFDITQAHAHKWFFICIQNVQKLIFSSKIGFILWPENKFLKLFQRLQLVLEEHLELQNFYRNFEHNAKENSGNYLVTEIEHYPNSYNGSEISFYYLKDRMLGNFVGIECKKKIWKPEAIENPQSFQAIIEIYQETKNPVWITQILSPITKSGKFSPSIGKDYKQEIVIDIIDFVEKNSDRREIVLRNIRPLLEQLNIEVLDPRTCGDNVQKCEHSFDFDLVEESRYILSYRIDNEISRCCHIHRAIRPKGLDLLLDFEKILNKIQQPEEREHAQKILANFRSPEFWYNDSLQNQHNGFTIFVPELVQIFDRLLYNSLDCADSKWRKQYEDHLAKISYTFFQEGFPLVLLCGKYDFVEQTCQQKKISPPPTELLPHDWLSYVYPGYPMPPKNGQCFKRAFLIENAPSYHITSNKNENYLQNNCRNEIPTFCYCRDISPKILENISQNLPYSPTTDLAQSCCEVKEQIYKNWPNKTDKNYNALLQNFQQELSIAILTKLVHPISKEISEGLISKDIGYQYLNFLHQLLAADNIPNFIPNPSILGQKAEIINGEKCLYDGKEYNYVDRFNNNEVKNIIMEIVYFGLDNKEFPSLSITIPSPTLVLSAGPEPSGLKEFCQIICDLIEWCLAWKNQKTSWGANFPAWIVKHEEMLPTEELSVQEFQNYANHLFKEQQIQKKYYPKFCNCDYDLASIHKCFFQRDNSMQPSQELITKLLELIQLLDTILALWYQPKFGNNFSSITGELLSATNILAKDAENLTKYINKYLGENAVYPVSIANLESTPITHISRDIIPHRYLNDNERPLVIRRRIWPTKYPIALSYPLEYPLDNMVVIYGRLPDYTSTLWQDSQDIQKLHELFLYIWCLIQQESNSNKRKEASQSWEKAYITLHGSGRQEDVRGVINAFYKISEILESALKQYQKFQELEVRFKFLEDWLQRNFNIIKIPVARGDRPEVRKELLSNFTINLYSGEGGVQYKQKSVIRVTKPAFIKDNGRFQMGELLMQK